MGTQAEDPWTRQHYDQIDFILVPKRWQNGVLNAESDTEANINSDHFPVWVDFKMKLKIAGRTDNQTRIRVEPIEDEKREGYNKELQQAMDRNPNQMEYKELIQILVDTAPQFFKTVQTTRRNQEWSERTETLLGQKAKEMEARNWEEADKINKILRNSIKKRQDPANTGLL